MDNNVYPSHLQHTGHGPPMPNTGQSHQMLHPQHLQHPQHPYHPPFANQVAHYHHANHQSPYIMYPSSPQQKHIHPPSWDPVSHFPHHPTHIHLGCLPFPSPSSPPHLPSPPINFIPHVDQFSLPKQHPPPVTNANQTASLRSRHHATTTRIDSTITSASFKAGVLRGPPKKPRQSGHALWIGNLPFSTSIVKLKEHFSLGAKATIESVFWISKSKSAFVNYKTAEALSDAIIRFHNSKFEGVLLVCRTPRADLPTSVPTASALRPKDDSRSSSLTFEDAVKTVGLEQSSSNSPKAGKATEAPLENNAKQRFFIMKSLAEEDLQLSVQNGHWMTQEHNKTTLNEAFTSAEEVYLLFSANRSGEYFGYARMQGLINALPPESRPKRPAEYALETHETDMPETVFTASTERAPEGAIFIDVSRGTIFWEAEISPSSSSPHTSSAPHESSLEANSDDLKQSDENKSAESTTSDQKWNIGCPFEIKWISTTRLPFYLTKGLKNPWNANREVKVARDGTELEPNIGIRMLELFNDQAKLPAAVSWDADSCCTSMSSLTLSSV